MEKVTAFCTNDSCFLQNQSSLRGEDTLSYTGAPGEIPAEALIRFHLYPRVSAAKINKSDTVKVHNQRQVGCLNARRDVSLDQSVYMDGPTRLSCQQIVYAHPLHIQVSGSADINEHSTAITRS